MNSPTMDASPLARFSQARLPPPSATAPTLLSNPTPLPPSASSTLIDHKLLHKISPIHGSSGRISKLKDGNHIHHREGSGGRKALAGGVGATAHGSAPTGIVGASRRAISTLRKLHDAASCGASEQICELLDVFGADADATDEKGRSALHFACAGGWVEATRLLLARGADCSVQDVNGNTPLHLAVLANQMDCVLLLLRANANAAAKDRYHRTPMELVQTRLRLITDRAMTEDASALVIELRTLVEILSICANSSQIAGTTPQFSAMHSTLLDPDLLATRLASVKTSEEVVDVVDELRELIELLNVS
ncbi:hypothetical protein HDU87_001148 [Geranomyces variabilis]|uniref:Uncharacterized protein n=1 Tax=Geranomyces variabilis TaxID=109894 RepID=A0AAD5XNJ3_9FUNG|nr:hypothetical protein HDU87_001148 [Geranomyces variabilis]